MDLDFLEIGTSDFDTLCQTCSDQEFGMSVEPIKYYLDRLPERSNVIKVQVAISNKSGAVKVYYVPDENIKTYNLPSFVRGCNSINNYHPQVVELLQSSGINNVDQVIQNDEVDVLTYGDLMNMYNIQSIKHLKIDTEGHDLIILESMLEYLQPNPEKRPRKITFESNVLHDRTNVANMILTLMDQGYTVVSSRQDTVLEYAPGNSFRPWPLATFLMFWPETNLARHGANLRSALLSPLVRYV